MSEPLYPSLSAGEHLRHGGHPRRGWRRENIAYSSKQLKEKKTALCIIFQILCGNHHYN